MQQRVTRQELHDLAWSEPMRTLAKRFGISDVAPAKTCRQMHVPTPPRAIRSHLARALCCGSSGRHE